MCYKHFFTAIYGLFSEQIKPYKRNKLHHLISNVCAHLTPGSQFPCFPTTYDEPIRLILDPKDNIFDLWNFLYENYIIYINYLLALFPIFLAEGCQNRGEELIAPLNSQSSVRALCWKKMKLQIGRLQSLTIGKNSHLLLEMELMW